MDTSQQLVAPRERPCLALWSTGDGWPPSEVMFVPSHGISVLQLRQREMPDFL